MLPNALLRNLCPRREQWPDDRQVLVEKGRHCLHPKSRRECHFQRGRSLDQTLARFIGVLAWHGRQSSSNYRVMGVMTGEA
jgi:hypothetical protein